VFTPLVFGHTGCWAAGHLPCIANECFPGFFHRALLLQKMEDHAIKHCNTLLTVADWCYGCVG